MNDYENTVKDSLSRLDSEELIEKLKKNYLTDEAKVVAEGILLERGIDIRNDKSSIKDFSVESAVQSNEDIAFVGYPLSSVFIWMASAFLFGISQSIRLSGVASDAPGIVGMRFFQGFSYVLIVGIVAGIYAFIKRKNITTNDQFVKKYKSNVKTIIVINCIVSAILVVKLFFGVSNFFAILDLLIIACLTFAIFKRVNSAKYLLATYAFINPVIFAIVGMGGPAGIVWSFVFLSCCQAIATEKRFSAKIDGQES